MSGKVTLIGAGPGDPGLFTLRGREALSEADVVVYDALVGPGVLGMIPEDARLIYVGKRASRHAMAQADINRVLLEEAQAGHNVARLKGGDPFLFGRGGEELELLAENGIPFEVIPGVTSAFSVPALNGIPVTHRDYTASVHVITGHRRAGEPYDIDFSALVHTRGTLVFLMGLSALHDITQGLMAAGMDPATPAAVLEKGATARQRRICAPLRDLERACLEAKAATPAIILVGPVCALAERFSWLENKPLFGTRVIVTRPRELVSGLAKLLRQAGAEVIELPAIRTVPVADDAPVASAIRKLEKGGFDWLVFTSPSGVRIFMEKLAEISDLRALGGVKLAAIGEGTRKALKAYGLRADFLPTVYDGETLGRELKALLPPDARLLIPRAAIGNPELIRELHSFQVTDLPTYDTEYAQSPVIDAKALIDNGEIDFCVFTSASTVRGFAAGVHGADFTKVDAVCIGRQTAAAARQYHMNIHISEKATLESLVECVKQAVLQRLPPRGSCQPQAD